MHRLNLTSSASALIAIIISLVPFFAFITVWGSSLTGHYTAWRLWDEVVLLMVGFISFGILLTLPSLRRKLQRSHLFWLIIGYAILEIMIGLVSYYKHSVTAKALGYGFIVDLRYLLFFLVCLIVASRSIWLRRNWQALILIPASIVIVFGLLQHFVLPLDFLVHFGYDGNRNIGPYETVNGNIHYLRIISTLRGANPLGAYLVIITALLSVLIMRAEALKWRLTYLAMLAGDLTVLFYSYSRSAWLGSATAVAAVVTLGIKNPRMRRWLVLAGGLLVILGGSLFVASRNSTHLENLLFHTQKNSKVPTTSDQGHLSALKSGIKDVIHEPLGTGPGTSGPASVYNNHQGRLPENYFLQVAEQDGWIGLVIFLLINWLVLKNLWLNRMDALSLGLLGSLIGLIIVNLFSHAWVDDTLSYIWWGLAGIALSFVFKSRPKASASD